MSEAEVYLQTFIRRSTVKILWDSADTIFLDIQSINFELQDIYNQNIIYKMDSVNKLFVKTIRRFIEVSYKAYQETKRNLEDGINIKISYIDNGIDNMKNVLHIILEIDGFLYRSLALFRVFYSKVLEGSIVIQQLIDDIYWLQNKLEEFPRDI